jgi:hypothetical protein
VDRGWILVRTHPNALRVRNFQAEVDHLAWKATAKVYGISGRRMILHVVLMICSTLSMTRRF